MILSLSLRRELRILCLWNISTACTSYCCLLDKKTVESWWVAWQSQQWRTNARQSKLEISTSACAFRWVLPCEQLFDCRSINSTWNFVVIDSVSVKDWKFIAWKSNCDKCCRGCINVVVSQSYWSGLAINVKVGPVEETVRINDQIANSVRLRKILSGGLWKGNCLRNLTALLV